jgi:dTDP-4-amino-4,6-dideoxygalactose transaminase
VDLRKNIIYWKRKMLRNPFEIVRWFEEEIAHYTGAPYAIATNSCTNAIFLACKHRHVRGKSVTIPKRTYLSVPQSIMQAGGKLEFEDIDWSGIYQLKPFPIYDSAKRLTSNMYIPHSLMCLSFHFKKPLKIGKGGMILTDSKDAVDHIKRMRYEGRGEGVGYHEDIIHEQGWNMYMTPEQAARGMVLLSDYPEHAEDQVENPPYRDLTEFDLFKRPLL